MTLRILETNGGALEVQIRKLEGELGRQLPLDYREFLLLHNGGQPEPSIFDYKLPDGRIWSEGVRLFFGLDVDQYHDFFYYRGMYLDRIPENCIAIGNDSCGNLLVLSLSGKDVGSVYFWDHEEEVEDGEPPTYDNLYFIANSFTDFLNCLRPLSEEELDHIEKHAATAEVK